MKFSELFVCVMLDLDAEQSSVHFRYTRFCAAFGVSRVVYATFSACLRRGPCNCFRNKFFSGVKANHA